MPFKPSSLLTKMRLLRAITHGALLFASLLHSSQTLSNVQPPQPYHIEMIIFERTAAAYDAPEYWRKDFGIAYPPNYRIIQSPENISTDGEADQILEGVEPQNISSGITAEDPLENSANQLSNERAKRRDPRMLPERPADTYILNNEAQAIVQKNQMRVLFHKAWQQSLLPTEQAPYVVVTGGDIFDNVHELGGTIRFSVNKFIHVDTQLWLTQFTPNYGQESTWPSIPLEPSLSRPSDSSLEMRDNDSQTPPVEYGINATTIGKTTSSSPLFKGTILNDSTLGNPMGLSELLRGDQTQLQYLPNEIILLEQSRRMRSRELHYIDHPRLGILIKVLPISFEEASKLEP